MEKINNITSAVIAACIEVHSDLGPGLFESVHEEIKMDIGFKTDFIIENEVAPEVKSIEAIHHVHKKQLLTYLRLANKQIGLLINFNEEWHH